jgi:hypothetical protein
MNFLSSVHHAFFTFTDFLKHPYYLWRITSKEMYMYGTQEAGKRGIVEVKFLYL